MTRWTWKRNSDHVLRVRKAGQGSSAHAAQEKASGVPVMQHAPFQTPRVTVAEQHCASPCPPKRDTATFISTLHQLTQASCQPDGSPVGNLVVTSTTQAGRPRFYIWDAERGQVFPTYTRGNRY